MTAMTATPSPSPLSTHVLRLTPHAPDWPTHAAALQQMVSAYVDTWYPDGGPWSAADVALVADLPAQVSTAAVHAWVGYAGTRPVGCVLLVPQDRVAEVSKMYVDPDHRGTTLAESLLEALAEDAGRSGFAALDLIVAEDRVRAQRFYLRCGLTQVADPSTPDGFVKMTRRL